MDYLVGAVASVIIAAIVFTYLIVRMAMQHEDRKLAAKAGKNDQRIDQILAQTQAEVAALRERVQVLERLATDEDRRVASEISKLSGVEKLRGSDRP